MRDPEPLREVSSSGGLDQKAAFGISAEDQAHVLTLLRSTIYNDRVLAVLREYSTNAWDAHKQSGKGHIPIKVELPAYGTPLLSIRDFGAGLSEHDVFHVFTQYGASTKRGSNLVAGYLGIGSKAGFAYTDSFVVISWHAGTKTTYAAFLDATHVGEIRKLAEEPCGGEEVGLEIRVPVKPTDVWQFREKATTLYQHFDPVPVTQQGFAAVVIPECSIEKTPLGYVDTEGGSWTAVMGPVGYRLNTEAVSHKIDARTRHVLSNCGGVLYFDIGEVQVVASREELRYTDYTVDAVVAKLEKLLDHYAEKHLKVVSDSSIPGWERRQAGALLANTFQVILSDALRHWSSLHVEPLEKPKSFTVRRGSFYAGTNARVVFVDKALGKATVLPDDTFVNPLMHNKVALEAARLELAEVMAALDLSEVPVVLSSELPRPASTRAARARAAQDSCANVVAHRKKVFLLKQDQNHFHPYSASWEPLLHTPSDDDYYVILDRFKVCSFPDFYRAFEKDKVLAGEVGITLPVIYGYKTAKSLDKSALRGRSWGADRVQFFRNNLSPEAKNKMLLSHWNEVGGASPLVNRSAGKISAALGPEHPLSKLTAEIMLARQLGYQRGADFFVLGDSVCEKKDRLEAVYRAYPLLIALEYWGAKPEDFVTYIKLMDAEAAKAVAVEEE